MYSDTISDSGPGAYANHRFDFTTEIAIPAGGYIRFVPEAGMFTIPSSNFGISNVDLYVATSSGFVLQNATATPSATEDGISITTGSSSPKIEVTLNSTTGIPANARVRLVVGNDTVTATTTDLGILNPSATGTHEVTISVGGGSESASGKTLVAIIDKVGVGPVDTTETIPPERFNGAPTGTLSGTTLVVQMSLETDEFAKCRYSEASGTPYYSMTHEFTTYYTTVHTTDLSVATDTSYTFYIRCIDDEGNYNKDDYIISFTVPEYPTGTPGSSGSNEGEGTGTGAGSGTAENGGGDPSGNDNTSGGSTGGGGGGGPGGGSGSSSGGSSGSGGFEGVDQPYQSGDGQVIINGYAFPGSSVVVLVDGVKAETVNATNDGHFSATLNQIARGVYNFGVYAVDKKGTKSSTFTTTFTVTGGRGSTLSNVNIMPTILVTPDPVDPGSTVNFSGYSVPNATITVENVNDQSSVTLKSFTSTSDSNGAWSLDVDTTGFDTGTWKVRARAVQDSGVSTAFSDYTYYGVGQQAEQPQTSDLNQDGFVNLIDFSILLYWWNTDGGNSNPPADINQDGTVSLTDFSIMIYNWTG
jgi:hypothetical protein